MLTRLKKLMAKAPSADVQEGTINTPVAVVLDKNDKFVRLEDNSDVELVEGRDYEVYVDEEVEVAADPTSARGVEDADTTTNPPNATATPASDGKCVDCKGTGLKDPSTMCPTCDGTGQEKVA